MKSALVTGSAGFVGRHLVRALTSRGWEVTCVDVRTGEDCRDFFRKVDARFDFVAHCAAIVGGRAKIDGQPLEVATDLAIDSDFFQWVVRTRPHHVAYFSSSATYPVSYQANDPDKRLNEHMASYAAEPDAIYGWVKVTGERVARLVQEKGIDVRVYRPFSGYGSDQDLDYPFPSLIARAKARVKPFPVWGKKASTRDWIHIDDVVEAVITGMDRRVDRDYDKWFPTMNLCTGVATSFEELAIKCAAANGYHLDSDDVVEQPGTPMGVMYRVGDPSNMRRLLRWEGRGLIPLEEGIFRALHGEGKLV